MKKIHYSVRTTESLKIQTQTLTHSDYEAYNPHLNIAVLERTPRNRRTRWCEYKGRTQSPRGFSARSPRAAVSGRRGGTGLPLRAAEIWMLH